MGNSNFLKLFILIAVKNNTANLPTPICFSNMFLLSLNVQVDFVDQVCLPVYRCMDSLSPESTLRPLLSGCQRNRTEWDHLAEMQRQREGEEDMRRRSREEEEKGK